MDLIQEFLIPPWVIPLVSSESWLFLCDITSNPWLWRVLIILLFLLYVTWPYSTFKALCIPGPPPMLFLGSIPDICRKDLHIVDVECYNAFGNIWGLYLGRQAFLVLTDTEIIHKVFIEDHCEIFASAKTHKSRNPFSESFFQSDDQDWKRLHQLLTPAFSSTQLRQTFPLMAKEADDLIRHFGTFCREGRPVTVRELFAQYARNVLTMSLFDLDMSKANASRTFIHYWDRLLQAHARYSTISVTLMFPALMPLIRKIKFHLFWKEAIGYFTGLVHHARERRKDSMEAQKCASFLQYLLDHEEIRTDKRKKPLRSSVLTEGEIVAQVLRFLLSGYKTTTYTLEFAVYLLARHPSVQHKLQQEICTAVKQEGLTYESIVGMEYLDMVVMETLRLFPPLVWLQRTCRKSVEVCDVKIPKGIQVTVPVWVMHHSREYWEHPCRFNPLRFTRQERDAREPECFLPFGLGSLSCIGSEFNVMMIKVALASILKCYSFTWCSLTPMYLDIETLGATRSKIPIILQVDLL
ncbi:cytochrome P450 3A5-like isoform X1 [Scyliorhinus canicula]|uniref:cytochrome P450 3A5-like isoform X1 n=1 Tax=Scyliorhinus canicula TaxID=7830 RepID=UPI0018F50578|nr:cytochrome P450 3A5-like isoform X1 [Scyliorhinus canicula]XP_038639870.1 cytochrome P450 3A5-like isoform X1 [Scyliorhinus canicula]XP_038639871.1 cytochrome P450 3A5-like isoform X1 [Scyliorhinus canicula]